MLLELKNIKKYFPIKKGFLGRAQGWVRAVDDIDLTMALGEHLSIVGESGSGKTTLARVIMKLYPQDHGQMKFDGKEISRIKSASLREFRSQVQMVFQDPFNSLDPRFTVRSILKEAFTLDKGQFKTEVVRERRIQELMGAVHLEEKMLNRFPHEFSGGERQRIAIARALVMNPKLLILDEAVSSLDVIIQEEILKLLKELQEKFQLTYLFISHNLRVVRKISKTIAVMYRGKIVELAPTAEIFEHPLHPYTKELLTAAMEYKAVKKDKEITLDPNACLADRGNGHLVLQ